MTSGVSEEFSLRREITRMASGWILWQNEKFFPCNFSEISSKPKWVNGKNFAF